MENTILATINFGVRISLIGNFTLLFRGFIPSSGSIFPYNRGTKYKVGSKANKVPEKIKSVKNSTPSTTKILSANPGTASNLQPR